MAVRIDVKLAIDAGYAVKTVWANLWETDRIELRDKLRDKPFLNDVRRCLSPSSQPAASALIKLDPAIAPVGQGFHRFRRATETPVNRVLEVKP
jgi:hypothetical protein